MSECAYCGNPAKFSTDYDSPDYVCDSDECLLEYAIETLTELDSEESEEDYGEIQD